MIAALTRVGVLIQRNSSPLLGRLGPLRALMENPVTGVAVVILLLMSFVAIAAPLLAPQDPSAIDAFNTLANPSAGHWLGTDQSGRDVLSRLIYGTRISLPVGLISVSIAFAVGVPLGLVAGYRGGLLDSLIMRMMDGILAFPSIMLALGIIATLGPGLPQIMIAIGFTSVPVYARVVRAQVLSLKQQDFVTAAIAIGASTRRILFRHILPNTLAPLIVQGSLGMAFAILSEAGLSFLGVGVQPPTPSWGGMLQSAVARIYEAPWLSVYPGVAIVIVVLALNLVGDGLRDALDPRLRGRLGSKLTS